MGAWGLGNFENDDAGDWVYDLEKTSGKSLLHKALSRVSEADCPEAPTCCEALAAAEVVLAGLTGRAASLPEEAQAWLAKKSGLIIKKPKSFDATDARLAVVAVRAILNGSELAELWKETDDCQEWRAAQEDLARRLEFHA